MRFDGIDFDFPIVANTTQILTVDTSAHPLTGLGPGTSLVGVRDWDGDVLVSGAEVALADRATLRRLTLAAGSLLAPVAAGLTAATRAPWLHVVATQSITIASGGAIDASARGEPGDCAAGDADCGNLGGGAAPHVGGSHGGLGGGAAAVASYDDANAPTETGAGGGRGDASADVGGAGGGRVYLAAPIVRVDGRVAADGAAPTSTAKAGGGAGGAIWIAATNLLGAGTLSAAGGAGSGTGVNAGGGGGGGRIRLQAASDAFAGGASAVGGTAAAGHEGSAGSIVRGP